MAELDPNTLARVLTRLHHSARGTGEGEDWYQVPVSLMNVALAALQRIPELERRIAAQRTELERAERVEATARTLIDGAEAIGNDPGKTDYMVGADDLLALHAALAAAPAVGMSAGNAGALAVRRYGGALRQLADVQSTGQPKEGSGG